jgi:alpha-L-arabinofuranosidase
MIGTPKSGSWQAVILAFLAPSLLGGIIFAESGTGSLPQSATTASITIDASKVEGSINPMLYGQFDEFMFEGVKGGLYAELIRDRSFEQPPNVIGLPRYWERDPDERNDDPALRFHWDDSVFYPNRPKAAQSASHSVRVDVKGNDRQRRGLHQSGIPVRQGINYHGYLWIKSSGFEGLITVALEGDWTGGETYASTEIHNISGDWKKYEYDLTPLKSDLLAKFAVLVYGRGRIWMDQVSLMPGDAVDGVRADVFQKVEALHPAFIRWPGGNVAQDYHWMWGVGPRDQRTTWVNLSWANEPEPSDFGTDEFIRLCHNLGSEPSITVNVEGGGAAVEEAAAWVEYANGAATSKYGAMRAANGHPEPFRVRYWEIGNEIWGDWVRGHSDAETYARNYNRYAKAMRAIDPSIHLIAVGDNNMNWNRTVLRSAGSNIDYLAIHHYYGTAEMHGDPLNLMAHPLFYEHFYKQVEQLIHDTVPGHEIKLAINEWNTSLPLPRQHSMEAALYAARLMNVFERSNAVAMSAASDMVNGWSGGLIQASRHGVFVTPTYLVNQLYNQHLGTHRLMSSIESPTFDSSREGKNVPYLDTVVSRTLDGRQIFIKAVNADPDHTLRTTIRLTGATVAPQGTMEVVNADSATSANSFSNPDAITIQKKTINAGSNFEVEFPEHSVSVIALNVAQ